ncbi:aminotransferase class I/II-fold pyridoxal phosphate-dependent enzyme [Domibacillus sp. A3M-37]|uniref:aminotransferase class I/II-fold pyridoxal phosphate-dependent enzyme n=1 Tax=Domibacillus sp. A3M-37 TaxID=2962037 RepID=UPI0020B7B44A|nr:aminotransferase class I/II-fold pyridoxal phosphate-dependent enzyme [Domibacillus sp. A3M-37]MCP3761339.1 aminotransferase class I/II-fold pyridoxal phosphate-dependent enzyme [Domibacillus sp. A3M-37]
MALISTSEKRIYLSPPHMSGHEQQYLNEAFETNWIAPLGPNVDEFERRMSAYAGTKGSVAVNSGTAAIHLALILLNVSKGDVVFCSTLTFVASANPIVYAGAEPVFIDSDADSWNMSPQALERALYEAKKKNKLPKAVIIVHLYGQSAKMHELVSICRHYGVPIIEDAAESLGSEYMGQKSGSMGEFGVYSFNGNKIITTSGGGMLVSNDTDRLEQARNLAAQAREPVPHYQHQKTGYNYRMSNLLAGIGIAQLGVLDDRVAAKRALFVRYKESLRSIEGVQFADEISGSRSNRWLTTLIMDETVTGMSVSGLIVALEKENIEARHIWKPLHTQPLFKGCEYFSHREEESVSDQLFATGICLPSGTNMSEAEQDRVIEVIQTQYKLRFNK